MSGPLSSPHTVQSVEMDRCFWAVTHSVVLRHVLGWSKCHQTLLSVLFIQRLYKTSFNQVFPFFTAGVRQGETSILGGEEVRSRGEGARWSYSADEATDGLRAQHVLAGRWKGRRRTVFKETKVLSGHQYHRNVRTVCLGELQCL